MAKRVVRATVNRRPLTCNVCGNAFFTTRRVLLNSGVLTFFGLDWLNCSAVGAICTGCGFVHQFVGRSLELWDAEGGYPPPA